MSHSDILPFATRARMAAEFNHPTVVASYRYRPEPPGQTIDILEGLIADEPRVVLDIGCGTGFLARPLAPRVDRLDAMDVSPAMIEEGMKLPGGKHPGLRWIIGRVEDARLEPPYALVTAGDSLHWMDWERVLPRLAGALSPSGVLALVDVSAWIAAGDDAFRQKLRALLDQHVTSPWRLGSMDLVDELKRRALFREIGRADTDSVAMCQPVDDFIRSYHARASLFLHRLQPADARAFRTALRQLLLDHISPEIDLVVRARIVWGRPEHP